jgi:hypothetical protein
MRLSVEPGGQRIGTVVVAAPAIIWDQVSGLMAGYESPGGEARGWLGWSGW